MKKNLLLTLAFSVIAFLPITAQQGNAPSTPDNQNPPTAPSQSSPDRSSAPDAQKPDNASKDDDQPNGPTFTYRVNVVQRTTEAVDYRDRRQLNLLKF